MIDKYLGIVLIAVVLYYLFNNAGGTSTIIKSFSGLNTNAIAALQGRQVSSV